MGIETILMAFSTTMSVIGQVQQGQANKKAAYERGQQQAEYYNAQAQQTLNDAAYRADAAKAQAEKIRRAGKTQIGEANASLAASGVKLGEGTPLEVQKSINQNSEEDALSAILSGKRISTSAQEESSLLSRAGRNALKNSVTEGNNAESNSYWGAASTVLRAGGTYARGGWKELGKGK